MRIINRTLTAAALLAATSCSSTVRTGNSPMLLVIDNIQGIRGASTAGAPSAFLISDLITNVTTGGSCTPTAPCPTVFGDNGQAVLELAKKDVTSTTAPTTNNQVTINRIHIHYRSIDPSQSGLVPADFDAYSTATVPPSGTLTIGFELVRISAKVSQPLLSVLLNDQLVSAAADVTFYGTDQVGNAISATGSIAIEFGNFGDPTS
jgi:hypothetical protein